MPKREFLKDLERVYELIKKRTAKINELYSLVDNSEKEERKLLKKLLRICSLEPTKQNKIALLNRLINLREDSLVLSLSDRSDKEVEEILAKVFDEVSAFHTRAHEELLRQIEEEDLLSPFYQTLLRGVHEIGAALTKWQPKWTKHIINTINPMLLSEFKEDKEVVKFLTDNALFDKTGDGKDADRSYSVLIKEDDAYKSVPYATAFAQETKEVCAKIDELIKKLQPQNDDIYDAKEAYIVYLLTLKNAFLIKENSKLISAWQDVDRAWMNIKTPIQIGHPLEYYEDHYKKAVALEWDIRLSNPQNRDADKTQQNIRKMYEKFFLKANGGNLSHIYEKSAQNVQKSMLFISRPMLYYAAEFNGLFSAQVVPNDELVSKELGKKIFAYPDNVLDGIRAKPFMKISNEVFGAKFLKSERELIFKKPELWHKVYEITTIGHEFGHILWMDEDTETLMNKSGVFKNIEEFKATTGGLAAFFDDPDETLLPYVINDTIKRSVGLIAWMKTAEVEPYYCESLIHLSGLFESGVLAFGEKLEINTNEQNRTHLVEWYFDTYLALAKHYLAKKDAKEFLDRFAVKSDGVYMPVDKAVNRFVSYYWELYKSIGRDVDTTDSKENWL
ncbi:MAG: invasion protein CiaB [Campylobacteraceae bacterium]|nr:invasion protein CiaB [Campylobacteraceae bacterium]